MKGKGKALARSWSSPGSEHLQEQHSHSSSALALEEHPSAIDVSATEAINSRPENTPWPLMCPLLWERLTVIYRSPY